MAAEEEVREMATGATDGEWTITYEGAPSYTTLRWSMEDVLSNAVQERLINNLFSMPTLEEKKSYLERYQNIKK